MIQMRPGPCSSLLCLHGINGELGTDDFAVMAVHALVRFFDRWRVISLAVEPGREIEDRLGAELDAVTAPLAAVFEDVDDAMGDLNLLGIQWNTPKGHLYLWQLRLGVDKPVQTKRPERIVSSKISS
jgi:hypothetical protein